MEVINDQMSEVKRQAGVTTVEYAIMLVLIAIAVIVGAPYVSSSIINVFGHASSVLH